jgi:lysine 2,3-aminomutase
MDAAALKVGAAFGDFIRGPHALNPAAMTAYPPHFAQLAEVAARYATAITPAMEALIDPSDPDDPIARQFRPDVRELRTTPEESADPIADHAHTPVKGLVHRYRDRVLLKLTHSCPVYCRFCFRREMVGPGGDGMLSAAELDAALAYIAARPEIWEVIFTGGDPFTLSPRRIGDVTARLASIPHVKITRWHTRVPAVAPDLVTDDLIAAFKAPGLTVWVALHANHPRELTADARGAIGRLVDAGIPMVSQSVLLAGVNDDAETLEALMRAFVEARVKPYYLHHPDLAPGTGHFRLPIAKGQDLAASLHARASGLCQPSYVLDAPSAKIKAPLARPMTRTTADDRIEVRGADGAWREYP